MMARRPKPRVKVTHEEVAEAIGYVMRKRLRRMSDAEIGRWVLLLTTGRP